MTPSALMLILGLLLQTEIPYKPSDEFQIKLDYSFRIREYSDNLSIDYERNGQPKKTATGGTLPYLIIHFKILKLVGAETRMKIVSNKGKVEVSKKVDVNDAFKIDLGYTDDIKDRVTAYEYTISFSDAEKTELSRVFIEIMEDGTFLVNGQKRGKF